jgi:hypothetical protein
VIRMESESRTFADVASPTADEMDEYIAKQLDKKKEDPTETPVSKGGAAPQLAMKGTKL